MWRSDKATFEEFNQAVRAEPLLVDVRGIADGRERLVCLPTALDVENPIIIWGRAEWLGKVWRSKSGAICVARLRRRLGRRKRGVRSRGGKGQLVQKTL